MRALGRRLQRIEGKLDLKGAQEVYRLVALLEARRKRWAEIEGRPYTPLPCDDVSGRSLVEVLQYRGNQPRRKPTSD